MNPITASTSSRTIQKPRSIVWKFYKIPIDPAEKLVTCPSCDLVLKFSGSTSGIFNHLKTRHKKEYKLLKDKLEEKELAPDSTSADREFAKSFATALLPFRFAKNPEFRNFLLHKPTEYSIPGPAKIKKLIDSMADEHVSKMKADLEGIQNYTILTNGYSDLKRSYHFYSLHISFIDSTFERQLRFLTLKSIDKGDHLAISGVLNNALNEFGLRFNECSLLTSDAASPLVLLAEKQLIDRYITTTRPTYKNPLVFWKGQCANFPKLSEIARILLASPASAACSERTFSRCSDFIRQKKRNRATIGTINSVLIVNELSRSQRPVSDTEEEETDSELSETDQDTMEDDSDEDIDQ